MRSFREHLKEKLKDKHFKELYDEERHLLVSSTLVSTWDCLRPT